ncbi:hypothetical protein B0J12DRAFT_290599 [Macrophomina phaseolina]|uniref:Uncharacterized protein n=1 Tax=Macrophomina phaseolina TaxID=35725 RepID=A0ABQ8GNK2_9PEZI|nr:hypothetical protein B0J12DRAFT_290599 [Macrophomina phaseolina]
MIGGSIRTALSGRHTLHLRNSPRLRHVFRITSNLYWRFQIRTSYWRFSDETQPRPAPPTCPTCLTAVGAPLSLTTRTRPTLSDFHITTTDRDIDAEKQDRLHDGQLFRLNRQARGEAIQQPQRRDHGPNRTMFGPPPSRNSRPALPPILDDPGKDADPLALAKALQFKGSYSGKGRGRTPAQSNQSNNLAPSGPPMRGVYGNTGRGGYRRDSSGRNGAGRLGSFDPHTDIHTDQGLTSPRGASRKKNTSVVRANNKMATSMLGNHVGQPMQNRSIFTLNNHCHNGVHTQQPAVQRTNAASFSNSTRAALVMDRTDSSISTTSRGSSVVESSPSGAIFTTSRRPPSLTDKIGKLASPEEFMAAVKGVGLGASKYAHKMQDELVTSETGSKVEEHPKADDKLLKAEERVLEAHERLTEAEGKQKGSS